MAVTPIALSEKFPFPDESDLTQAKQAIASIPDDSIVILDGLAFGAMKSIAEAQKNRLCLIALCHHPLACLLYTSPSPRDLSTSRMPSSA